MSEVLARLKQDERGISLTELLVATATFSFVMLAIFGLVDTTTRIAPNDNERGQSVREAQVGISRMVRELRQATTVYQTDSPTQAFDAIVQLKGVDRRVLYRCDQPHPDDPSNPFDQTYKRCRRVEAAVGATLPSIATGEVVVDRVLPNAGIFKPTPAAPAEPTYVDVEIQVPARGERKAGYKGGIRLKDGFVLRNIGPPAEDGA